MTKQELKPIDTSKYKITETGQVLKMTKEECEIETSKAIMEMRSRVAKLEKENAQLKAFRRDCIKLTEDNAVMAKQRGEIAAQLAKAKEIIKDYLIIVKGAHTTVCGVPEENRTIYVLQLCEKAEQFISEEEK